MVTSTYDYSRYTPFDSTGERRDIPKSAYKNIRFALPVDQTMQIGESDVSNLPGLAFRIYGDSSLWRLILAYNGMVDPVQDMWPGQVLNLPSKPAIIAYLNSQLKNQQQTVTI